MNPRNKYDSPLDEAYESLRSRLRSMGFRYHLEEAETDDLIQDSYLQLSSTPPKSKEEARGKFLVTFKNLVIDNFRRKNRRQSTGIDNDLALNETQPEFYDRQNILDQLEKILSPLQSRIMRMLVEEDLDYPEIALKLDMTEGAVRTNVSRARKILKEKLER